MELITKKQKLKNAIADNDWKRALSISKGFTIEFNPEQQRVLQIAHETIDNESRVRFYTGMGVNVEENNKQAIALLKKYK